MHAFHPGADDMVDEGEIDNRVRVVKGVAEAVPEDGSAVLMKSYELECAKEQSI